MLFVAVETLKSGVSFPFCGETPPKARFSPLLLKCELREVHQGVWALAGSLEP